MLFWTPCFFAVVWLRRYMVCLCVCSLRKCILVNICHSHRVHTHFPLLRSHLPLAVEIKSAEVRSASQDKVGSVKKTNRKFLDDTWHRWHRWHRRKPDLVTSQPWPRTILYNAYRTSTSTTFANWPWRLSWWVWLQCWSKARGSNRAPTSCIIVYSNRAASFLSKITYKRHVEMLLACIWFLQTLEFQHTIKCKN